ncbi:hypothetical protein CASFOL_011019 [Castilleja foliolosa]|uniref:aspartate--tRNA ligase n=1 Tax=Castilleja foliolosa TaxID=1961234 RepID=A0ABD3DVB5_9LAMI
MSFEEPSQNVASEENSEKKLSKKDISKLERRRKRQELAAASAAAAVSSVTLEADPLASNYGDVPLNDLQSKEISGKKWTEVKNLTDELKDQTVLIRGRVHSTRAHGKNMAFVDVRESGSSVQSVLTVAQDLTSPQMVKYATGLSEESIVDISGVVSVPSEPITGTSQQVEIQVREIYCVNRAIPALPINIKDAARSDVEIDKALEAGEQLVRVNQDTRLNNRVLDLRTPANQGIFRIKSEVDSKFREFMMSEGFIGIPTPKIIAGSSEGGSAVVYLRSVQSSGQRTLLHTGICVNLLGLDAEMEIKEHYSEVMDIVDRLFVTIFDKLNENVRRILKPSIGNILFRSYLRKTLRLTFEEGVQMLKEAGVEIDPLGDLNTESERKLGQLVLEKYDTEFYILHRYPLAVRPFYTMPCHDNIKYSNSFDVFIRGEEIISGAQRIHVPELLTERAQSLGIDVKSISTYIDSFRYGAPPHGGFGAGLERVVMLFCALDNIRKTSLFPRDPHRIAP